MPEPGIHEVLGRLPLLRGIEPCVLRTLAGAARLVELGPHEVLFRAGEPMHDVHVLVSGSIKRAVHVDGNVEKVVELAVTPQLIDLAEAFHSPDRVSFAEALSKSKVLAIDAGVFRMAVLENPELSARVIRALAARQAEIEREVLSHPGLPVSRRVLEYLVDLAGDRLPLAGETTVMLRPTKQAIAARIGISPETLSRALNELSEAGLIVVERSTVHIQNAALAGRIERRQGDAARTDGAGQPAKARPYGSAAAALVNACGRQRMWSQRLAIAWILLGRHITPGDARGVLRRTTAQFERNLARLDGLGLKGVLLEGLQRLHEQWDAFRQAIFDAEPAIDRAGSVFALSEFLLHAADQLTLRAEEACGTPEAHRINVAGRNRMLSQRMTKQFLFCNWGVDPARARRSLEDARNEFLANLQELREASGAVPELAAQLDEVDVHWNVFRDEISRLPSATAGVRQIRPVLDASERLLRHVDTTVRLYERLAD